MQILALETSCDETAAAVVRDGMVVRSSVLASSKETFAAAGGVIPESAARQQMRSVLPVIHQALEKAGVAPEQIDALAVTKGPGLLVSLLVGTSTMRTLASVWRKPLIGVHHILGHLSSVWLDRAATPPVFPALALTASGGHTDLWLRTGHVTGTLLGRTRDDAAGEAFDKGAALLGLPYPGGPAIAAAGAAGDAAAFPFPLPLHDHPGLDFSFSGLKTSLRYTLSDLVADGAEASSRIADLAASYEQAICAHIVDRMKRAIVRHPEAREVHLVGGVSANQRLRAMLAAALDLPLLTPAKLHYCTDNAAMIAAAAQFLHRTCGETAFAPFVTEASLPLAAIDA